MKMKFLTKKRLSEITENLYAKAIDAGDVSLEDKHGFTAGVCYLIVHIEEHEFSDWQGMPGPDPDAGRT